MVKAFRKCIARVPNVYGPGYEIAAMGEAAGMGHKRARRCQEIPPLTLKKVGRLGSKGLFQQNRPRAPVRGGAARRQQSRGNPDRSTDRNESPILTPKETNTVSGCCGALECNGRGMVARRPPDLSAPASCRRQALWGRPRLTDIWPDTNTKPLATTACEFGERAAG
jgi:hypothetical protein